MSQKRQVHFGSLWKMVYFGLLASFPVGYKNCGISKRSFPLTHCLKWPDYQSVSSKNRLQQQNSVHRCSIVGHLKSKISHRRQKQLRSLLCCLKTNVKNWCLLASSCRFLWQKMRNMTCWRNIYIHATWSSLSFVNQKAVDFAGTFVNLATLSVAPFAVYYHSKYNNSMFVDVLTSRYIICKYTSFIYLPSSLFATDIKDKTQKGRKFGILLIVSKQIKNTSFIIFTSRFRLLLKMIRILNLSSESFSYRYLYGVHFPLRIDSSESRKHTTFQRCLSQKTNFSVVWTTFLLFIC